MVRGTLRSAFAEGSFGAGELNEQIERNATEVIFQGDTVKNVWLPERFCSRFSRCSHVTGKRYVHFFAHNEGGTALISPFTQFVCVKGLII